MKKLLIITPIMIITSFIVLASLGDLSDYPEFFASGSKLNAKIITGDKADDADWMSAVMLSNGFTERLSSGITSKKEEVDIGEDLRYGRRLNDSKEKIDHLDIDILQTSRISAKDRVKTKQAIYMSEDAYIKFESLNGKIGDYLFFDGNSPVYTYNLSFEPAAESDIINTRLSDIENQRLQILGNKYIINKALVINSNRGIKLELFGAEIKDYLFLDEEKTYVIGNRTVTIWAPIIDADTNEVELRINRNRTKPMIEGDIYHFNQSYGYKNYLEFDLAIRTIITDEDNDRNNYVEFFIGSSYLELEDENIEDNTAEVNGITQDESYVRNLWIQIDGEIDNTTATISDIVVEWIPKTDLWVPLGGKVSDFTTDKGQIFTKSRKSTSFSDLTSFDIHFNGEEAMDYEEIKIYPVSEQTYAIDFTGQDGRDYTIDVFSFEDNDLIQKTVVKEGERAEVGQNILFTNEDKEIWVMEIVEITADKYGAGTIVLKDKKNDKEKSYSIIAHEIEIDLDNLKYTLKERSKGEYVILEDLNGDGKSGGYRSIYTRYGGEIRIGFDRDYDEVIGLTFMERAKKKKDSIARGSIEIMFSTVGGTLYARDPEIVDDVDIRLIPDNGQVHARTLWGSKLEYKDNVDQRIINIDYPQEERDFNVMVRGPFTEISGKEIITDLKALQEEDINMIVVGGPCANQMAAELMDITDHRVCDLGFKEGESMIKIYDLPDGNSAVLIAGYSKEDTENAVYAFSNFENFGDFYGTSVKVKGMEKDLLVVTKD